MVTEAAHRLTAGRSTSRVAAEGEQSDVRQEIGPRLRYLRARGDLALRTPPGEDGPDAFDEVRREEMAVLRKALTKYDVLERVRRGGQGVVYRARQLGTNRIVALKLLLDGPLASARQRRRFEREIELVSRLRHPNIVAVHDSGVVRGRLFYAMEFVEGQPIDDYVRLHDLTPREIIRLVVKVCHAVYHAHQNGIIHRDLNPANILVDEHGEPRVYDFGLAKDLWADAEQSQSLGGLGCGTLPYLSPEQAGGLDGRADVRSDVYAIGLVLFELLSEILPYPVAVEPAAVRDAILHQEPLPLRTAVAWGGPTRLRDIETINRDLDAIAAKALAKAKDDRYQTTAELAEELERWLAGEAVRARADNRWYRLRKMVRRHRVAVGFAATIVAALSTLTLVATVSWLEIRRQRDSAREAASVAFDLFDVAVSEVEESVRPLAGGLAVRDRLIEHLTRGLPQLAQLAEADAALEPLRPRLLEKQGDIAAQQSDKVAAARCYQRLLDDSLRGLQDAVPDDTRLADAIRAARKLAEVSDDASTICEQGIALGSRHDTDAGGGGQARYELCELHCSYAMRLRIAERLASAVEQYDAALALCARESENSGLTSHWMVLRSKALIGKALALHSLDPNAAVLGLAEEGVGLRERLAAADPTNIEARASLMRGLSILATLYDDARAPEQAKSCASRAMEHSEYLAKMEPGRTDWDGERFGVCYHYARLCLATGDVNGAQYACSRALGIAEQRIARSDGKDAQVTRLFALLLRGEISGAEEQWSSAHDDYSEALVVAESLAREHPDQPDILNYLANVQGRLAGCARALGDPPLALEYRQREHDTLLRLRAVQPDTFRARLRLLSTRAKLAAARVGVRTADQLVLAAEELASAERELAEMEENGHLSGWDASRDYVTRTIEEARDELARARSAEAASSQVRP